VRKRGERGGGRQAGKEAKQKENIFQVPGVSLIPLSRTDLENVSSCISLKDQIPSLLLSVREGR
jgi:hypothetical protein